MLKRFLPAAFGILLLFQGSVVSGGLRAKSSRAAGADKVVLSGVVVSVNEARVPDAKVELVGKDKVYAAQTDMYGTFNFEVRPSRYRLRVEAPGYCPASRPEFELAPNADVNFVLAIFPCSIETSMIYKDGKYAGEECRYQTQLKEDIIPRTNSSSTSFDLQVRYGEKQETANLKNYQGGTVEYLEKDDSAAKGFAKRTVHLGVEINYNLMTITADSVSYDSRNAKIVARGNVVIRRANQTLKTNKASIDLHAETIIDLEQEIGPASKLK